MSLSNACKKAGFNGGTIDCPPKPGKIKWLLKWEGNLPVDQLLLGDANCEAILIGHSKKSKYNKSKLVVFPLIHEVTDKKEANTEVKFADGYTEVTREGLPAFDFKIRGDLYLIPQLRKGNNKRTRYAFVDDANMLLGTYDSDGNFQGRAGKFFTNGIDGTGYDKANGETMLSVQAENAYETLDLPAVIQLSASPEFLFKSLKDVQLYEKATATTIAGVAATRTVTITDEGTARSGPTRTVTITAIGSNGDTIEIPESTIGGSLTSAPVAKTASESSVTLLAAKIVSDINTNLGYSAASNAAGVITIALNGSVGADYNGDNVAPIIVGGITATRTAWAGGVDGDTIAVVAGSVNVTGDDPVETTSDITTPTLLATKVKDAINANTVDTGYSATSAGAVITITSPVSQGSSLNSSTAGITVTGTLTATNTAWTGGVTAGMKLKLSAKIPSPLATVILDIYDDYKGSALGTSELLWDIKKSDGTAMTVSEVTPNDTDGCFDVSTNITASGKYIVNFVEPDVLDAALVKSIEGISFIYTKS